MDRRARFELICYRAEKTEGNILPVDIAGKPGKEGPMIIQMPDPVRKVMQALQESNAEVYFVGGAVRDSLMNLAPKDYDIATTAGENKISEIARSAGWRFISNLGHNLGTCMVIVEGISIEISTLRQADGIHET